VTVAAATAASGQWSRTAVAFPLSEAVATNPEGGLPSPSQPSHTGHLTAMYRSTALCLSVVFLIATGLATPSFAGDGKNGDRRDVSPNQLKQACQATAQAQGFSVGDFGDVKFDKSGHQWVIKVNLQGSGEKFRGRCEWSGHGEPRLTEWHTGQDIMPRRYSRDQARSACKSAAMAQGFNVGDFGDTEIDAKSGMWVARLMVQKPGREKYKATCRWDGRETARIE
jgi:hypothetical protein